MNPPTTVLEDTTAEPTVVAGFGDDALGRVQGLLFGDHAQRTNERIDAMQHTLFDMIAELRVSIEGQLAQLADQLQHESQTREAAAAELADLASDLGQDVKALAKADAALGRKLDKAAETLRGRITQSAESAETALGAVREELAAELELMQSQKVERSTLAALLRATADDLDT